MALFGLREDIIFISVSGFLFFAMLPFANTSIDYLIRTNVDNQIQGRVWGIIGLISQLGYVAAYAVSGILADYVFTPLLLIVLAGLLLCATAVMLSGMKSIRGLEKRGVYEP